MAGYTVRCDCGRGLTVTGGDAGGEVACGCGRKVAVPSLTRLRASAGEAGGSPEVMVWAELAAGALPLESACVRCGGASRRVYLVPFEYQRPTVIDAALAAVFALAGYAARRGDGVVLPVRACRRCRSAAPARDLLARTPLYARLLAKYPHAAVGRAVPA